MLYSGESFSTSLRGLCSICLAKHSGDADAIIQRVVSFLRWVWLFIQLILGTVRWK